MIILQQNASKSFSFCFNFDLLNSPFSFFLCFFDSYFSFLCLSLLVFICFHSFHSFCFSLTLLLTFHHNVSLCVAGPFVHTQLLSVASSKTTLKTCQQPSTDAFFGWLLYSCWFMTWNHFFHCLNVVSFGCKLSPVVSYQWLMLGNTLFTR